MRTLLLLALLGLTPPALAWDGDAKRGESLVQICAACHGPTGVSPAEAFPNLAGQGAPYLFEHLVRIRDGHRPVPTMAGQLDSASDQDLRDMAAWYASQAQGSGQADPALAEAGKRLYLAGDASRGIPACTACHGPAGQGLRLAAIPHLAGQKATYTATMLRNFRAVQGGFPNEVMMQQVSRNLHDDDIAALSSYLAGLYAKPAAQDEAR